MNQTSSLVWQSFLQLLLYLVGISAVKESGQCWERRELGYLQRMILLLELNWPMTMTSNGMAGPVSGVFVGQTANCSLFLGAKSQGFQDYYHVWEDGDERYTVENVPLYDSAEDEPFPKPAPTTVPVKYEPLENHPAAAEKSMVSDIKLEQDVTGNSVVTENNKEMESSLEESRQVFPQTNAMISRIRSNSTCRNYNIGPTPSSKKRLQHTVNQKNKNFWQEIHQLETRCQTICVKAGTRGNKEI